MPKMKTHSGAKKRFRKTGKGKIKRGSAYISHHGWAKTTKQKRGLRGISYIAEADMKSIERLLPNG
ncbi:MAG: 50S ribosomal protein L35 [Candidatus Dependentiae bacterium]|jgi:large subunit ribosomal protein L35